MALEALHVVAYDEGGLILCPNSEPQWTWNEPVREEELPPFCPGCGAGAVWHISQWDCDDTDCLPCAKNSAHREVWRLTQRKTEGGVK